MREMSKLDLKIISLFSGAGGLDLGFENAGFTIAVAIEVDPACCETLTTNRPRLKVINKAIENVCSKEILATAGLKPLEAALVIGGPPCQSFSLAGKRKGLEDERGKLGFEFIRVVRETLPVGFVFENVKGLINWGRGKALEQLIEEFERPIEYDGVIYHYQISKPQVLNAVKYGVPQNRERVFIVGNRIGATFNYPNSTTLIPRTVYDAIGMLPPAYKPSITARRVAETIAKRRVTHGY